MRIVREAKRRSALLHAFAEDYTSDRMTYSAHGLHPKGRQSDFVARDVVAADDATTRSQATKSNYVPSDADHVRNKSSDCMCSANA